MKARVLHPARRNSERREKKSEVMQSPRTGILSVVIPLGTERNRKQQQQVVCTGAPIRPGLSDMVSKNGVCFFVSLGWPIKSDFFQVSWGFSKHVFRIFYDVLKIFLNMN